MKLALTLSLKNHPSASLEKEKRLYILTGKIYNRFKSLIVDFPKKQVAGRIVGIPMSYLQKPFSPILLIADSNGKLKESNPFAFIKRDYTNNTVEIFEPAP